MSRKPSFIDEYWLLADIGWVHVIGRTRRTAHVSEPVSAVALSGSERLRLGMLAADIVCASKPPRILVRAKLKPGCQWGQF